MKSREDIIQWLWLLPHTHDFFWNNSFKSRKGNLPKERRRKKKKKLLSENFKNILSMAYMLIGRAGSEHIDTLLNPLCIPTITFYFPNPFKCSLFPHSWPAFSYLPSLHTSICSYLLLRLVELHYHWNVPQNG